MDRLFIKTMKIVEKNGIFRQKLSRNVISHQFSIFSVHRGQSSRAQISLNIHILKKIFGHRQYLIETSNICENKQIL